MTRFLIIIKDENTGATDYLYKNGICLIDSDQAICNAIFMLDLTYKNKLINQALNEGWDFSQKEFEDPESWIDYILEITYQDNIIFKITEIK